MHDLSVPGGVGTIAAAAVGGSGDLRRAVRSGRGPASIAERLEAGVEGWVIVLLVLALLIAYYRWSTRERNREGSTLKPGGRRDHENDDPPWPRRGPSFGAGGNLGGGGSGG